MEGILEVCRGLKNRIEAEKMRLAELKDMLINLTVELNGMPRAQNSCSSRIDNLTAKIIDTENFIMQLTEIKSICIEELSTCLSSAGLNSDGKQVILYRYGYCLPFEEIARRVGYHVRTIFKIHSAVLKVFSNVAVAGQF